MPNAIDTRSDDFEHNLKRMAGPLIKQCDMNTEMKDEAADAVAAGVEKFPENMEGAAKYIKDQMGKKYGGKWHVACGEGFGCSIEYEQKHLLYMFFGGTGRLVAVLVYKSCELG